MSLAKRKERGIKGKEQRRGLVKFIKATLIRSSY